MGENVRVITSGQTKEINKIDLIREIFIASIVTFLISWLFYDSIFGIVFIVPVFLVVQKIYKENKKDKFKEQILKEYKEFLNGISEWITSGVSVESAFVKEEKEIEELFGKNSILLPFIKEINFKVKLNNPVEKAFLEFAQYINIGEVKEFAGIFIFVKRLGGDYSKNIRNVAEKIGRRVEIKEEIEVITTEKRIEMIIMSVIPLGIILFLRITAIDFIGTLYHQILGNIVMTISLVIYAFSIYMANKIIKME